MTQETSSKQHDSILVVQKMIENDKMKMTYLVIRQENFSSLDSFKKLQCEFTA